MKHRLALSITVLASTISVGVATCWIASFSAQVSVVWTSGTTHNQFISYNGAIYLVQNYNWWRKESLATQIDPEPGTAPIATWPGMRVDSQNETIGFTTITGKWVSPFIQVTANTEFTSPDVSIKPGTMYYSTTPMLIRGVQYWLLMAIPASWLLVRAFLRFRTARRRHVQSRSDTESVLITAS